MLTQTTVQLANPEHAVQIAAMSRDLIEHGLGWSWTEERVAQSIRSAHTNVAVALAGDTVLAFGIMNYRDEHAYLALLAVRPSHQRQGLASCIIEWLQAVAAAAGAQRILLECRRSNVAARSLYSELGFHERRIEAGMYRGIEDGIALEKWIAVDCTPQPTEALVLGRVNPIKPAQI